MKQCFLLVLALVLNGTSMAQLTDSFDDGDFTNDPTWSGQNSLGTTDPLALWEIVGDNKILKSKATTGGAGTRISYLSTPFDAPLNLADKGYTWQFKMQVAFTVSASLQATNNARVYLFTNEENTLNPLNGYFVQLRDDRITLARQTGTTVSVLSLSGNEVAVDPQSWVEVKVTRTEGGVWEVFVNGTSQGTVTDTNHTAASYFGVQVRYSANDRSAAFSFDDFLVEEIPFDTSVLTIVGIRQIGASSIGVRFNQPLGASSSQTASHYQLSPGLGSPARARINPADNTEAILDYPNLSNLNYTLTINGVTNEIGDGVASGLTATIKIAKSIPFRAIVINEIMADPSARFGLPDEEYLELFNTTNLPIDLGGFIMDGYGNNLSSFVLQPSDYVIITKPAAQFSTNRINITSGALTNGGERLRLIDNQGNVVDDVTYATSWYTTGRVGEGYALERINPYLECTGPGNWRSSISPQGGTPGLKNSVFDDRPDNTPPRILSMSITNGNTISFQFSEYIKKQDLLASNFSLAQGLTVSSLTTADDLTLSTVATLSAPLVSETNYTLTVRGLRDCVGNVAADTTINFYYDVTPPRLTDLIIKSNRRLDLVFSEEIRSTTSGVSAFRINDSIASSSRTLNVDKVTLNFPTSFSFARGLSYSLRITGIEDMALNRVVDPIIQSFVYREEIDSAVVVSANTLDVYFSRPVNQASATKVENYLLNTVGTPQFITYTADAPRKVRLVFGNVIPQNRNLLLDVQDVLDNTGVRFVTPTFTLSFDTSGPTPERLTLLDANTLLVHFSEPLERTSAEITNNYRLEDGSFPISAQWLAGQNTVRLTFTTPFENEKVKTLNVNRVVDALGNAMTRAVNLTFVYDILGPRINLVRLVAPNELEVVFSETVEPTTAQNVANYAFEGISPVQVTVLAYQANTYRMIFNAPLPEKDSAIAIVRNVLDVRGNKMEVPVETIVNSLNPIFSGAFFPNDSSMVLHFSKLLDVNSVIDTSVVKLGNLPQRNAKVESNQLHVFFATKLVDKQSYLLTLKGMKGSNGAEGIEYAVTLQFNSFFTYISIVEDKILELKFSQPILPITVNQLLFDIPIVGIVNQPENQGTIKVFLAEAIKDNRQYTMTWRGLKDNFGRSIPDFKATFSRDKTPPRVVSIQSLLNNLILVKYSERIDPITALAFNHYALDTVPVQPIQTAQIGDSSVMLTFGGSFVDKRNYRLSVRRVNDISRNVIRDTTIHFQYIAPYTPQPGDLIINEIMANPTPPVGLPDAEYIEIYNASDQKINLFNVAYSDNLSTYLLGNVDIAPGEYLIVCDDSHESLFKPYGRVTVLGTFPALGNSGDSLVLSVNGVVIDRVQYATSWYRDSNKNSGGYSLERIGLQNDCAPATNWIASYDSSGGTPGRINSAATQYVDSIPPRALTATLIGTERIDVTLSEAINPPSALLENFNFGHPISSIALNATSTMVSLTLDSALPTGKEFELKIANLQDCSLNAMLEQSFILGIGERPTFNQILITEIMANPKDGQGLPVTEYLEIFNTTDRLLTTANIVLRDNTSAANVPTFNLRPGEYVILCPTTRAAEMQAHGRAVGVPNWPSLNIGGERLSLNLFEQLIFTVTYSDTWYKSTSKSSGGFSLEMIDTQNPCGEAGNWTASEAPLGGTPGKANSVAQPNPDRFGPKLTNALAIAGNTVRLVFDEKLLPDYPIGEFTFSPTLTIQDLELLQDYKTVDVIFHEALKVNQKHEVHAKNVRDCISNIVPEGSRASFVLPSIVNAGEVIINELLFNPLTGGSNFLEIFNHTDNYYNLRGWKTTNDPLAGTLRDLTTTDLIMAPGEYLVFAPNTSSVVQNYPHGQTANYYTATLPSLPNGGGRITLMRPDGLIIDDFTYREGYHNPLLNTVKGVSLERVNAMAPTNDPNNWKSAGSDAGYATPGRKNSQARSAIESNTLITISPKVFVPGGINSFTTISYQDDNVGGFASIAIYDTNGRTVKSLAQNQLLSANGFFTWDGTTDSGLKVRTGVYVVLVELYYPNGNVEVLKETVVIGATF